MSKRNSNNSQDYNQQNQNRQPKKTVPPNQYTLILLFTLVAMIAACVMLYLDINSYK